MNINTSANTEKKVKDFSLFFSLFILSKDSLYRKRESIEFDAVEQFIP